MTDPDSAIQAADLEDGSDHEFTVRDAASANWVVRKIVEARAYADRVKIWAELECRRAKREEEFFLRRFGVELEAWARLQIAQQHDRRRSVSLPAGVVGFRKVTNRLSIIDEKRLLFWCRQHLPSAIRTIESVPKTPLMDYLKATGECPPGTQLHGGDERFHITAKNLEINEGGHDGVAE
jgi:hypothetical protein